jgi:hypothetical protein
MFLSRRCIYLSAAVWLSSVLSGGAGNCHFSDDPSSAEIVIQHEDGTVTLREVEFIGPRDEFKAKAVNGLKHDWEFPVFLVEYEGHTPWDSQHVRRSLEVEGWCSWPIGHTCSLTARLGDFGFFVEKFQVKLIGGKKILTPAEQEAEAERRRVVAAEEAKLAAEKQAREKRLAAEQKRAAAAAKARKEGLAAEQEKAAATERARESAKAAEEGEKIRKACRLVYLETADLKIGDLTVRQSQQVRACQALGLYPPPE